MPTEKLKTKPAKAMPERVRRVAEKLEIAQIEETAEEKEQQIAIQDLTREHITIDGITLKIPNMIALEVIMEIIREAGTSFSPCEMITIFWVLENQKNPRILELNKDPLTKEELFEFGKDISYYDMDTYRKAIVALLNLDTAKKKWREIKRRESGE